MQVSDALLATRFNPALEDTNLGTRRALHHIRWSIGANGTLPCGQGGQTPDYWTDDTPQNAQAQQEVEHD